MPLGAFTEEDDAISKLTLKVNVVGPMNGMKAVLPIMIAAGKGHIINVASMAGKMPFPGMVVYNASKFGAVGLTAGARSEYARSGVSISAILPSAVRTELSSGVDLGGGLPTVDPEDIAKAIVGTVRSRRAETTIPRHLAGWNRVSALVPEVVVDIASRVVNDRRGLDEIDDAGRKAYADRVPKQAF